jgi:serine/threonine protein kinase
LLRFRWMEYGSLYTNYKKFGVFSESSVVDYIREVMEGLQYLHELGIVHGDIKATNILLTKDGHIKLTDFGISQLISQRKQHHRVLGSPYWMAPELIQMKEISCAADIWSVGCTIFELIEGKPPYYEMQPMSAMYRMVEEELPPPLSKDISPALREFLTVCFRKDPKERPLAKDLLDHPWLRLKDDVPQVKEERLGSPQAGLRPSWYSLTSAERNTLAQLRTLNRSTGHFFDWTDGFVHDGACFVCSRPLGDPMDYVLCGECDVTCHVKCHHHIRHPCSKKNSTMASRGRILSSSLSYYNEPHSSKLRTNYYFTGVSSQDSLGENSMSHGNYYYTSGNNVPETIMKTPEKSPSYSIKSDRFCSSPKKSKRKIDFLCIIA